MVQLTGKNLTLGYDHRLLVENLNFSITAGNYVCILGENGAGKSTLMKTLLDLKKPLAGEIILSPDLSRKDFGYLTQQKEIQKDFPASVYEIVLSGFQSKCGLRPFYNKAEKEQALQALATLSISDLKKSCFRELSGGQQQRVLLARALCSANKMLFLDEPVTGLDPHVTHDFYHTIATLNASQGITIVIISHDIDTALKYASHILHVGQSSFWGTKEDYLKSISYLSFNHTVKGGLS